MPDWRVRACAQGVCSEYSRIRWVNVGRTKCDYNADGYDDVAIGVHGASPASSAIYFYYGISDASFGLEDDGIVFSHTGPNDGFGISLLDGSQGLETTPSVALAGADSFGVTVDLVGDVNDDGFDDVAVADRSPKVLLCLGRRDFGFEEPDVAICRDAIEDRTGQRLGSPGDINGDGYSDFKIAVPEEDVVHFYYGRSVVVTPLAENASISQPPGDREFGFAVAHR
ncbi:hypothetical protein [Sorangium sp. So ce887]|uniref:hypothetical protein n=1 Tax=Sorangium sp. So ce887 TaxID=3133324 RepID=UPI003F5F3C8C